MGVKERELIRREFLRSLSVADARTPVPEKSEAGHTWLRAAVLRDPFGSDPVDKLRVLAQAEEWSTGSLALGRPAGRTLTGRSAFGGP